MVEVIHMERTYGKHHIQMVAQETPDQWDVVARCDDCVKHIHFRNVDFGSVDHTVMIHAELSMHGEGISDGWTDGEGFTLD